MKSLTVFLQMVLAEAGTGCDISTERDQKTISDRVEKEGFSFLTITLPSFGKDLEIGLSRGYVGSDLWTGFRRSGGQRLPAFLRGFTSLIFDTGSGVLLDNPDVRAIAHLRQVSYLLSKIEVECKRSRTRKAIDAYVKCEKELVPFSDNWRAALDLSALPPYPSSIPTYKMGVTDKSTVRGDILLTESIQDDVRAFLELARYFGVTYSQKSVELWLLTDSHRRMGPALLPTGFTETRSFVRISGPIGLKTATFLMGGTLSAGGGTMTLTMSSSSNLELKDQ